jgi:phage tail tape-measure protein
MKKILLSTAALFLSAAVLSAEVVLGTGAVSQSEAGHQFSTLGGAGSLGNGVAVTGSLVSNRNYSAGIGIGGTIGLLSGATTSTVSTGTNTAINGSASQGGAGGFSGSSSAGAAGSAAFAFGGLGVFQP